MLAIPANARIFFHQERVDLRKGFEGLSAIVESTFQQPPTNGAYFVFLNSARDRMKVLYWDNDGFAIWYKRLERGRFPKRSAVSGLLERRDFFMLLEGIVPRRLHKRFQLT